MKKIYSFLVPIWLIHLFLFKKNRYQQLLITAVFALFSLTVLAQGPSITVDKPIMLGVSEKMNTATGLFVTEDQLFVTDFENQRVLVFFQDGQLAQVLEQGLEKPIDAMVMNDTLYIVDYKKSQMNLYYFDH
ncbi:MAG: hypothetical protein ACI9KR_000763 [Arcticibacterium sp.]